MTSCIVDEIEEAIERVSKQHVSLRRDLAAVYRGEPDTEYHLRYVLRCLGLATSGPKEALIKRIEEHDITPGETIHDPSALGNAITFRELDSCPIYLLKVHLKRHGLPTTGRKSELVARVRMHLAIADTVLPPNDEDKRLVAEAIRDIDHKKTPSRDAINAMELHGYLYDPSYNTFFHMITHEKVLNKKGFFEALWFMTYPPFPTETMVLISTG